MLHVACLACFIDLGIRALLLVRPLVLFFFGIFRSGGLGFLGLWIGCRGQCLGFRANGLGFRGWS